MKLVICEKNISAKRISYILSDGKAKVTRIGKTPVYEFNKDNELWNIIGLRGHIINLDFPSDFNRWNKIPPVELIDVEPVKKISEKNIAASIKSLTDKNPFLIVATDYDREGELIGVEVVDLIKNYNKDINEIKRAKFSAITSYEIKNAFQKLVDVDYNLSSAGETRQIIDLIWGAVLTRFISLASHRYGKDFLSIGRVQSPTLAILVERERDIKNFEPKTFWKIIATLKKKQSFQAVHSKGQFWDEKEVKKIFDKVKSCKKASVLKVDKKVERELPPSPFNTTKFLEAASYQGLSASRAMSVAEELYMYGLTSYPRTDNTVYPRSLNIKSILKKLLNSKFSKEAKQVLEDGRKTPTRGKKLTTDHPPIHPVGVPSNIKLNSDQQKVYDLICRRFLSTLAKDAISETINVIFDIDDEKFKSEGYRLLEANWRDIYIYFKEKRKPLPELFEGEKIDISRIVLKEDNTKPPSRYNQGSLIAKMEQLSLGTKSTRHEIISKLYYRKYITLSPLAPTPTAFAVVDALEGCDVIKPKMTAQLEKDMDKISDGKKTLENTVKDSRKMLKNVIFSLEKDKEKIKTSIKKAEMQQSTVGKCPICGKDLIIRKSRKGKRFVGCKGYPDCKNTYSLPQQGAIIVTNKVCKNCNTPVVRAKSKGKRAWELCLNPDCPGKKSSKKA